eukprot:GHVQ01035459.1.p2 GENE.GHVQ01035459.1~~GHVQ01035459.1.p2  ORF type:complete len:100 (+),score=14.27 GHVQ01035459.1:455-754(+)
MQGNTQTVTHIDTHTNIHILTHLSSNIHPSKASTIFHTKHNHIRPSILPFPSLSVSSSNEHLSVAMLLSSHAESKDKNLQTIQLKMLPLHSVMLTKHQV